MRTLATTTTKLQLITSAVGAIDVAASWADLTTATSAVSPNGGISGNVTQIITAATTDIVGAPAAGIVRRLQDLSIRNAHATTSNTVTVQRTDGTIVSTVYKVTLKAGEALMWSEGQGWYVLDVAGGIKASSRSGLYLRTTLVSSTTTTFTTGPDTNSIFVRGCGAGAGGAGCTSVAAAASAGGGGGAGAYAEKTFAVTPNTTYTCSMGVAGAGGVGALGANGGNTTITIGSVTLTIPGGTGAPVATALTTLSAYPGGAGGVVPTSGDVNLNGQPGQPGVIVVVATPVGVSGNGGSNPLGAGGLGISAAGNGNNATGFGGGGGGALTGASVARTGGAGTGGALIIDEFA